MKYLLLIYDEEKSFEKMTEAEGRQLMSDYAQFSQEIQASGHYKTASRLQPTASAWLLTGPSRKRASNSAAII